MPNLNKFQVKSIYNVTLAGIHNDCEPDMVTITVINAEDARDAIAVAEQANEQEHILWQVEKVLSVQPLAAIEPGQRVFERTESVFEPGPSLLELSEYIPDYTA